MMVLIAFRSKEKMIYSIMDLLWISSRFGRHFVAIATLQRLKDRNC